MLLQAKQGIIPKIFTKSFGPDRFGGVTGFPRIFTVAMIGYFRLG